jgi:peptide chain release factor 1
VRERRRRRRVGVVVGGHVDRLHRRDRTVLRRRDALLQLAHFREQRRLVTDRRRHAAEQRRHFGTRLREAEDVVDEQEHVLVLGIAEVLGNGQRRESDAQARSWRFGHLSVDQRGAALRHVLHVDDARLLEFQPEVVAFARAFADAAEHRHAAVLHGDVVDQLHDDDGLADAGAAEQTNLAALQVRLEQVDDLDARSRTS